MRKYVVSMHRSILTGGAVAGRPKVLQKAHGDRVGPCRTMHTCILRAVHEVS
jgi:hypothetical protein